MSKFTVFFWSTLQFTGSSILQCFQYNSLQCSSQCGAFFLPIFSRLLCGLLLLFPFISSYPDGSNIFAHIHIGESFYLLPKCIHKETADLKTESFCSLLTENQLSFSGEKKIEGQRERVQYAILKVENHTFLFLGTLFTQVCVGFLKACDTFIADILVLVEWQRDVTVLCVMENDGFRRQQQIFLPPFFVF